LHFAVICHTNICNQNHTKITMHKNEKTRICEGMSDENCHTYLHAHDRDTRRDSARSAELSRERDASAPDQELDLIRGERESDARAHARTRANRVAGAHEGAEFVVVDLAVIVGVHLLEDPLTQQPGRSSQVAQPFRAVEGGGGAPKSIVTVRQSGPRARLQPGLVEPPLVQGCLDLLAREEARA